MQPSVITEVLLPAVLALIMFGMGLTLTIEDFRRVVVYPKAVAIGLVAQIVLLPLLGFALVSVLKLDYPIAAGLMILALSPGGPTASLITFLARGDAAVSVTLTATSSLVTLVSTPFGLMLALNNLGGAAERVHLPVGQTLAFLLVITIIPTALGMWLKARKPESAAAMETPFKLFGLVTLILIICAGLLRERENLASYFAQAGIAAFLLNVLALAMGAGLALLFKLNKAQATCIAIDTGNCNGTLSIAIAATILRQPDMAIAPAIYSLLMLIMGGLAVFIVPKLGRRMLKTEPMRATNVGGLLREAAERFEHNTAMILPSGGGNHRNVTYVELEESARRFAKALQTLDLKKGDRIAILADNSATWAMADWGAQTLGLVTVPIFPTLTQETVRYIVQHSESHVVLVGSREQERKLQGLDGVRLVRLSGSDSLEEIANSTSPLSRAEADAMLGAIQPDDLSTIIYTSGTTGNPKGVMLTNGGLVYVLDGARKTLPFDRNEVFLSFLPMSHVYERVAGQMLPVVIGSTIVYSRGLLHLTTEMQDYRPSAMLCVPRFLEATMERILENGKKLPWLDRKLFEAAVEQGKRKARKQFAPWAALLDMLVLANVRDRLGGNFRYFVSGGAALPRHVGEFYSALGLTVLQGYGLTETGGATFVNRVKRNKFWTVGEPIGTEVKLGGDGEILLRGPGIMKGYYKNPEATAEAIDKEGWFHTGDIGEWEGPSLKITDRKKDLFKLSNGKYIAPQQLENKLKESPYIQEAVIFGEGQDLVTALVIPLWDTVRNAVELEGIDESKWPDYPEVRSLMKEQIDAVNKTLAPHELIKRFSILERPFTIESGELTPTFKVKRRAVSEKYADQLASMR